MNRVCIGFVGDANSGKSTLQNAMLEKRVLPSAATSCTSILTHVRLSDVVDPTVSVAEGGVCVGVKKVKAKIQEENTRIRESGRAGQSHVVDIAVTSAASEAFRSLHGRVCLIDVPGQNETSNPSVVDCFKVVLRLCDLICVVIRYDAVNTEATKVLLKSLSCDVGHLLSAFTGPRVIFAICQCDSICNRLDADSDEEEDPMKPVKDLRDTFLNFLQTNFGTTFQGSPVVLISAKHVLERSGSMFQWEEFVKWVLESCKNPSEVRRASKLSKARLILYKVESWMDKRSGCFPMRADAVIRRTKDLSELSSNSQRDLAMFAPLAISNPVFLPFIGAVAVCHTAFLAMNAKKYYAYFSAAWGIVWGVALAGETVVDGLGAIGAANADSRVHFDADYVKIIHSRGSYQDTLLTDSGGYALYIGDFVGSEPSGQGRVFWDLQGTEAIIGEFIHGKFVKGHILDEMQVVIGKFKMNGDTLEFDGYQPGDDGDDAECSVCMENISIQGVKKVFKPCGHGSVCGVCAEKIVNTTRTCPSCRAEISGFQRYA